MEKRLLLFDIDGTLVSTMGAGIESLKIVIEKRYGVRDDLQDIEVAGKTDSNTFSKSTTSIPRRKTSPHFSMNMWRVSPLFFRNCPDVFCPASLKSSLE